MRMKRNQHSVNVLQYKACHPSTFCQILSSSISRVWTHFSVSVTSHSIPSYLATRSISTGVLIILGLCKLFIGLTDLPSPILTDLLTYLHSREAQQPLQYGLKMICQCNDCQICLLHFYLTWKLHHPLKYRDSHIFSYFHMARQ